MNTEIVIPKEQTFHLPEGRYRAEVADFKEKQIETAAGTRINAVILFKVTVPGMLDYDCMARKVLPFSLEKGSELRRFLTGLLGPEFFSSRSNQRINLHAETVTKACELVLVHAKHDEEKFRHPLVDVAEVHSVSERGGN